MRKIHVYDYSSEERKNLSRIIERLEKKGIEIKHGITDDPLHMQNVGEYTCTASCGTIICVPDDFDLGGENKEEKNE